MTTRFDPCSGPSSGHKSTYSRKLHSISHKIYHSKIQRDFVFVEYSNGVSCVSTRLKTSTYCITKHNEDNASEDTKERLKISFHHLSLFPTH